MFGLLAAATLASGCGNGTTETTALSPQSATALKGKFAAVARTKGPALGTQNNQGGTQGPGQQGPGQQGPTQQGPTQQGKIAGLEDDDSFYVAVHKDALAERWFLSAYLEQYFPGAVSAGAARSLGTKVVSFKIQNGKLYLFSADSNKNTSYTFTPDVLVDAYDIVTDFEPFNQLENAADYVLFDPAATISRFSLVADAFSWGAQQFDIDLTYSKRFRLLEDGVAFQQVFTGYANVADPAWADYFGETNTFRGSGTLGIALRQYKEGAGFQEEPNYDPRFFTSSDLRLITNTGDADLPLAKWNIQRGMKPIVWKIAPGFVNAQQDRADLQGYDLVGAVKRGIENWNAAFGFEVLKAEVASGDESMGDDDINYLVFDEDPSYGAAFANWRNNPNTGEIRGASVYFNSGWINVALNAVGNLSNEGNRTKPAQPTARANKAPRVSLAWDGLKQDHLCFLDIDQRVKLNEIANQKTNKAEASLRAPGLELLSDKQIFENYITHVVVHEIGHTLGLRHNFAGSLTGISSSVMDYLQDPETVMTTFPGTYDVEAIRALYLGENGESNELFCNDGGMTQSAYCSVFDYGDDPFTTTAKPDHDWFVELIMSGLLDLFGFTEAEQLSYYDYYLNELLKFARDSYSGYTTQAIDAAFAPLTTFAELPYSDDPWTVARYNVLTRFLLKRLYLDPASAWGQVPAPLAKEGTYASGRILPELEGNLVNLDGLREFETRRLAVDVLKALQTNSAAKILLDGRAAVEKELYSLGGADRIPAQDLLDRINAALAPYYN